MILIVIFLLGCGYGASGLKLERFIIDYWDFDYSREHSDENEK